MKPMTAAEFDKEVLSRWPQDAYDFADAYAAYRVRAALEEAARLMENGELRYEANQIRALMPEAK